MTALEQRRGDDLSEQITMAPPIQELLDQGILTPTAFHVGRVITRTERSDEDDLTQVPEFMRWAAIGEWLATISTGVKWWIGDWLAFGEGAWGERYAQAAEATGLDIGTLQNYAYVCRQVLPSRRRPELSWTTHLKVAPLEPNQQKQWLAHASEHRLRSKDLEAEIRHTGGQLPTNGKVDLPEIDARARVAEIDADRVMAAARKVWRDATSDGNGGYLIPAGTFKLLASALGKEDA